MSPVITSYCDGSNEENLRERRESTTSSEAFQISSELFQVISVASESSDISDLNWGLRIKNGGGGRVAEVSGECLFLCLNRV